MRVRGACVLVLLILVLLTRSRKFWAPGRRQDNEYKDFDKNPYLLNFTNGTVDLRTSTLRAHDPQDMISCLVPHTYNPYAQAALWERLIYRCTQCDASGQTAEYLLRVLGYMLVGNNIEQKLPLIIGEKRTGKSKIVEICARLLGPDYAVISQSKLVTKSRWSTHHDSETWSIRGKRFVAISETDARMDLDEAMVKNLTGASTMAMRGLWRDRRARCRSHGRSSSARTRSRTSRSGTTQLDGV